jgi:hypothetical protein
MRRLGIVAVGLALVVGLLVLGACGGRDAELQEYARQMQGYFDAINGGRPDTDALKKLTDIHPARELGNAHGRLVQAAEMAVLAHEHAKELEPLEQQRFNREYPGDNAIVACVNSIDTFMWWSTSQTFREACGLEDAAFDAYVNAVLDWAQALSKACGGTGWYSASLAIEMCLS